MRHSLDLNCFLLQPDLSDEAGVKHVKAWLEYKAGYYCEGDPDGSCEARDFYRIMWGEFLNDTGFELRPKPREFSKNPKKYVQGDWMCSVATTFRKGLILFVNDEQHEKLKKLFPEGSQYGVGGRKTYVPIVLSDIDNKKQFKEFWNDPVLQNFIRSAYTFANLIIVPDGFNAARRRPTEDYWDRTLKMYYEKKELLKYKGKDVSTPFQRLLDESKKQDDALCLSPCKDCDPISFSNSVETGWLDKDDNSIPLRDKKLKTLDEWRALMQEMTDRIDNRRVQMQVRINELMKR